MRILIILKRILLRREVTTSSSITLGSAPALSSRVVVSVLLVTIVQGGIIFGLRGNLWDVPEISSGIALMKNDDKKNCIKLT